MPIDYKKYPIEEEIREIFMIVNNYDRCPLKDNKYCILESNKAGKLILCKDMLICPVGYNNKNYE